MSADTSNHQKYPHRYTIELKTNGLNRGVGVISTAPLPCLYEMGLLMRKHNLMLFYKGKFFILLNELTPYFQTICLGFQSPRWRGLRRPWVVPLRQQSGPIFGSDWSPGSYIPLIHNVRSPSICKSKETLLEGWCMYNIVQTSCTTVFALSQ